MENRSREWLLQRRASVIHRRPVHRQFLPLDEHPRSGLPSYAWLVLLGFGVVDLDLKLFSLYVWLVRGG